MAFEAMNILTEGWRERASSRLKVDRSVRLEGDVTTLTVTFTNPGPTSMKDVVIEALTLDKEEPRERATLPARFASLAPGATHQLILHFDKVRWIDDGVGVDRDDLAWARKPLEYKANWVVTGGPVHESRPGVEVNLNFGDSHASDSSLGLIALDPEDARALKKRRDADRKGP